MAAIARKTIPELVARYKLEPSLQDVYVEGPFDKQLIGWFVRAIGLNDARVYEISSIDVPGELLVNRGLSSGERSRVVALACELADVVAANTRVTCLVDADLDRALGREVNCRLLLCTDYTSMEMYFFNRESLDKYFSVVLGVTIDAERTIDLLSSVLVHIFAIRLAMILLDFNRAIPDFTRSCNFSGEEIQFDCDGFEQKILTSYDGDKKELFRKLLKEWLSKLPDDPRNKVHGHDFVDLLWSWTSTRARRNQINGPKGVLRALVATVDAERLRKEGMFLALDKRLEGKGNSGTVDDD